MVLLLPGDLLRPHLSLCGPGSAVEWSHCLCDSQNLSAKLEVLPGGAVSITKSSDTIRSGAVLGVMLKSLFCIY